MLRSVAANITTEFLVLFTKGIETCSGFTFLLVNIRVYTQPSVKPWGPILLLFPFLLLFPLRWRQSLLWFAFKMCPIDWCFEHVVSSRWYYHGKLEASFRRWGLALGSSFLACYWTGHDHQYIVSSHMLTLYTTPATKLSLFPQSLSQNRCLSCFLLPLGSSDCKVVNSVLLGRTLPPLIGLCFA